MAHSLPIKQAQAGFASLQLWGRFLTRSGKVRPGGVGPLCLVAATPCALDGRSESCQGLRRQCHILAGSMPLTSWGTCCRTAPVLCSMQDSCSLKDVHVRPWSPGASPPHRQLLSSEPCRAAWWAQLQAMQALPQLHHCPTALPGSLRLCRCRAHSAAHCWFLNGPPLCN